MSLLELDTTHFAKDFNLRPFSVRHRLVDHPAFTLERLVELARRMPADRVEYNAGSWRVSSGNRCWYDDSQLKRADTIRQGLESKGFSCQLITPSDIRHAISNRQLADYCGSAATYMRWTELITASLDADAVVLAIQGPQV